MMWIANFPEPLTCQHGVHLPQQLRGALQAPHALPAINYTATLRQGRHVAGCSGAKLHAAAVQFTYCRCAAAAVYFTYCCCATAAVYFTVTPVARGNPPPANSPILLWKSPSPSASMCTTFTSTLRFLAHSRITQGSAGTTGSSRPRGHSSDQGCWIVCAAESGLPR